MIAKDDELEKRKEKEKKQTAQFSAAKTERQIKHMHKSQQSTSERAPKLPRARDREPEPDGDVSGTYGQIPAIAGDHSHDLQKRTSKRKESSAGRPSPTATERANATTPRQKTEGASSLRMIGDVIIEERGIIIGKLPVLFPPASPILDSARTNAERTNVRAETAGFAIGIELTGKNAAPEGRARARARARTQRVRGSQTGEISQLRASSAGSAFTVQLFSSLDGEREREGRGGGVGGGLPPAAVVTVAVVGGGMR